MPLSANPLELVSFKSSNSRRRTNALAARYTQSYDAKSKLSQNS
jgi:hypothetical protein